MWSNEAPKIRLCPRSNLFTRNCVHGSPWSLCEWVLSALLKLTQTQWLRCRPKIKIPVLSARSVFTWDMIKLISWWSQNWIHSKTCAICFYSMTKIETRWTQTNRSKHRFEEKKKTIFENERFSPIIRRMIYFKFWCYCKRFMSLCVVRARLVCLWRESDITLLVWIQFSSVQFIFGVSCDIRG